MFNIPQDVCAIQFAESVKTFTRNYRMVKEIHLIDKAYDKVKIIQTTFRSIFVDGRHAPYDINIYLEASLKDGNDASATDKTNKPMTTNGGKNELKPFSLRQDLPVTIHEAQASYIADKDTLKCFFSPGHIVEVYAADIFSLSGVEAVVCCENKHEDAKGVIGSSVFRKDDRSGKADHTEFVSPTSYGDVITTHGDTSGFKWIMHVAVPRNSAGISVVYRNVFKEVKKRNITSLALPILVTGM